MSIEYFSFKQLREIVESAVERVSKSNKELVGKLSLVKFELRQRIASFIERETDRITHAAFDQLFKQNALCFQ